MKHAERNRAVCQRGTSMPPGDTRQCLESLCGNSLERGSSLLPTAKLTGTILPAMCGPPRIPASRRLKQESQEQPRIYMETLSGNRNPMMSSIGRYPAFDP